jgi:hypothetical protein
MFDNLYFEKELVDFLHITSTCKVSMLLLNASGSLLKDTGNFIKRDSCKLDYLTYIPKSKYNKDDNIPNYFRTEKGRVSIKVGRFIMKFLSKNVIKEFGVSDSDIELFVNLFKSYFTPSKNNLKIVEGDDIFKYYNESSYATTFGLKTGSLWKSCMRQPERNKFMQLYVDNIDLCKMLVFLTDTGELRARAILWENVQDQNGETYKVMDRIYSIYDQDVYLFKSWAKENGYIYKMQQSASNELFFEKDGLPFSYNLSIKLDKYLFGYYPYLDTFKYFDIKNGIIYNHHNIKASYKLVQSNGSLEKEEELSDDVFDYNDYDDDYDIE